MNQIDKIRRTINSANVNFLIGAGLSYDFLGLLENIEARIDAAEANNDAGARLEAEQEYFQKSMAGNLKIVDNAKDDKKEGVLNAYREFYKAVNRIILERETPILTRQINIFTTNIDIFSEKALEELGIDFNDGFHGRFNPLYSLGNFKKSYFKTSLHYENISEIPVFNIMKLHGSLSWKMENGNIHLDNKLDLVRAIQSSEEIAFEDHYKKLLIVNPSKLKLADTIIGQQYYDLLRVYSNELEKENSVLFVMGFSFKDQHIHDITLRVADSNPTLKVFVFSHKQAVSDTFRGLEASAKNTNIEILCPENDEEYNLETITDRIFKKIMFANQVSDGKTKETIKETGQEDAE